MKDIDIKTKNQIDEDTLKAIIEILDKYELPSDKIHIKAIGEGIKSGVRIVYKSIYGEEL